IEGRVGEAEAVEIYDKNPLAKEEQLAGLESAVRRPIRAGLNRRQTCRQSLREPLCHVRVSGVVGSDQRGSLACALRLFRSSAWRFRRSDSARVHAGQGIRRHAELLPRDNHVEDLAAASPYEARLQGAQPCAQRLRFYSLRCLYRLVERQPEGFHGAKRARQDGLTRLRLLGVESPHQCVDRACTVRIAIHFPEERQVSLICSLRHSLLKPESVAENAAAGGFVADGIGLRRNKMPGRVAKLDLRRRLQGGKERTVSPCGTARGEARQAVIGWEGLHHEAQIGHQGEVRRLIRERCRLSLPDSDAVLPPCEGRLAGCQADPALGSAATGPARGSERGHLI